MKKIKNLTVEVTYRVGLGSLGVGLGSLEVPEVVHKQLTEIADNGREVDGSDMKYTEALEWMNENIKERDCMDWSCEIEELEEEE